jgi:hypothetical protein
MSTYLKIVSEMLKSHMTELQKLDNKKPKTFKQKVDKETRRLYLRTKCQSIAEITINTIRIP